MEKIKKIACWAGLILLLPNLTCGGLNGGNSSFMGTDTGNPPSVNLHIVGFVPPTGAPLTGLSLPGGLNLTEARIVLGQFEFRDISFCSGGGSSGNGRFEFFGPFVVDLLSNFSVPNPGFSLIPSGVYCRIELKLDNLDLDQVPPGIDPGDPIIHQSVLIKGTRNDGIAFTILVEGDHNFKIENQQTGFVIGGIQSFLIGFDLSFWFSNVNINNAPVSQGTILIDKSHNQNLLGQIVTNIQLSSRLFEDQNSNGTLDLDEENNEIGQGQL